MREQRGGRLVLGHSRNGGDYYMLADRMRMVGNGKRNLQFKNIVSPIGTVAAKQIRFSTDGKFCVLTTSSFPASMKFYSVKGLSLIPISFDTEIGSKSCCAISSNGLYAAFGVLSSDNDLQVYKNNGDSYVKLTDPASPWAAEPYGVAFSPDDIYLALAHYGAQFLSIYKRSGDIFAKLSQPDTPPAGIGYAISFSNTTSAYLAVTHAVSPFFTIYKRNGDIFTKLASPASLPTGEGRVIKFSPDDLYLAIGSVTSPYLTIYKRSGDTFTKLAGPSVIPSGQVNDLVFTPDGKYLIVGYYNSPFITIYEIKNDVFTSVNILDLLPTSTVTSIGVSPNNDLLLVFNNGTPGTLAYK